MKIALVRVKYNSHIITPPLGIGYISSCLKQHGHETLIIDALRDKLQDDEIIEILDRNEINVVDLRTPRRNARNYKRNHKFRSKFRVNKGAIFDFGRPSRMRTLG